MKPREALAMAENVISKCRSRGEKMALYISQGVPRIARTDSPVFERIEANGMKALVGIYSHRCNPEWVKDDLLAAFKNL